MVRTICPLPHHHGRSFQLGIATLAEQIIIAVACLAGGDGLSLVLDPAIITELSGVCSSTTTLQMRVTSIITSIATSSAAAMQAVVAAGALTPLFDVIKSDDVLLKLTAMEQVGTIATLIGGFRALVDADVVTTLASFLQPDESDPFAAMLLPGVLEFFGRLGATPGFDYAVLDCKPQLVAAIGQALRSGDPTLQAAAAGATTALAQSGTGIPLLLTPDATSEGRSVMHLLGAAALSSGAGGQVKGAALDALASCFSRPRGSRNGSSGAAAAAAAAASEGEGEFSAERLPMYAAVTEVVAGGGAGGTVPVVLMGCADQPFDDVKQPAFRVLQGVATHAWGCTSLLKTPAFLEWMLDRGSGNTDAKFTLAENVAFCIRDEGTPELVAASSAAKPTLLSFLGEGRYFKERQEPEVMIEDNVA